MEDALFEMQHDLWKNRKKMAFAGKPLTEVVQNVDPDIGRTALAKGKVACVLLAGGVGTRLGFDGPKGSVKLPSYDNRTLFEIFQSKAKNLPVAVMCSRKNADQTKEALQKTQSEIFLQSEVPYLDERGQWILEGGEPKSGPDGNGSVFSMLDKAGILNRWEDQGVEVIRIIPVDNPKADPMDPLPISLMLLEGVELVVTAIESGGETGVLIENNAGLHVAEYNEQSVDGTYAYSGLCAFTMAFAKRCAKAELPWHIVQKTVDNKPVWKFEKFIFDLFPFAKSYKVIYQTRNNCFAPIKHKEDIK